MPGGSRSRSCSCYWLLSPHSPAQIAADEGGFPPWGACRGCGLEWWEGQMSRWVSAWGMESAQFPRHGSSRQRPWPGRRWRWPGSKKQRTIGMCFIGDNSQSQVRFQARTLISLVSKKRHISSGNPNLCLLLICVTCGDVFMWPLEWDTKSSVSVWRCFSAVLIPSVPCTDLPSPHLPHLLQSRAVIHRRIFDHRQKHKQEAGPQVDVDCFYIWHLEKTKCFTSTKHIWG